LHNPRFTQDSCQHVPVVPNSRRKWLSHQPHQGLFQYAKRPFATRKADTDFLDVRQVFHPSVARALTYKRLQRYLRFFGRSPLISDAARKFL
jgi:hypothetical protein